MRALALLSVLLLPLGPVQGQEAAQAEGTEFWQGLTVLCLCAVAAEQEAIPVLIDCLADQDEHEPVGREALLALVLIGEPAIPALVEWLSPDLGLRPGVRHVFDALSGICNTLSIPVLTEYVREPLPLSLAAAFALGRSGDVSAVPALIECLSHEALQMRGAGALALGQIGHTSAVPALIAPLNDSALVVRLLAARALGQIGDLSAVPELERLLDDDVPGVRSAAEQAIANIRARHAED